MSDEALDRRLFALQKKADLVYALMDFLKKYPAIVSYCTLKQLSTCRGGITRQFYPFVASSPQLAEFQCPPATRQPLGITPPEQTSTWEPTGICGTSRAGAMYTRILEQLWNI
jgi:hypothetical protein